MGGAAEEEMWTGGSGGQENRDSGDTGRGGTRDKKNGVENGSSGLRFTNNIMSQ